MNNESVIISFNEIADCLKPIGNSLDVLNDHINRIDELGGSIEIVRTRVGFQISSIGYMPTMISKELKTESPMGRKNNG